MDEINNNNVVLIDGKRYREIIEQKGKFRITHQIPIMTKEEKEKKEKEILLQIYRAFNAE